MSRTVKHLIVVSIVLPFAILWYWWSAVYAAPEKVPLEYLLGRASAVEAAYFPHGGEHLAFSDRHDFILLGCVPNLANDFHGFRDVREGTPPKVRYDFVFRPEYGFNPRLTYRPWFLYSSETGILRPTRAYPHQWCVAPKEFQEKMRRLRDRLPKDPVTTPHVILSSHMPPKDPMATPRVVPSPHVLPEEPVAGPHVIIFTPEPREPAATPPVILYPDETSARP